jgi:hypothetical protein
MKLTKRELNEIIDSNGELIGKNDIPTTGSDLETQASNTTDYNAKVGMQPFRYDMLGRFGFTLLPFFEGKENQGQIELLNDLAHLAYKRYMEILEYYYKNPNKLKSDFRIMSEKNFDTQPDDKKEQNFKCAKNMIKTVEKHFENAFKTPENLDEGVVETKMPLTFKSKKNDLFYITFKFDDKGRLAGVDNKWDVRFPDWWGLNVNHPTIIDFFRRVHPDYYVAETNSINEINVVEDKLVDKKSEDEMSKRGEDKEVKEKQVEKIAGLINKKFDKKDIDKLINLLERG